MSEEKLTEQQIKRIKKLKEWFNDQMLGLQKRKLGIIKKYQEDKKKVGLKDTYKKIEKT